MIERQLEEFVTKNKCNMIWMEPDDAATATATGTTMPRHSIPRRRGRRRR